MKDSLYRSILLATTIFITCTLSAHEYAETLHYNIWATYLHKDKQSKEASYYWHKATNNKPSSLYSLKGSIQFLAETNKYDKIIPYIKKYSKKFEHDATIQRIFAHALSKTGKQKKADKLFIALHKQFPENQDCAFQAIQAHIRNQDIKKALSTAQTFLHKSPHKNGNFIFHFLQAQIYAQIGKREEARASLHECLSMHPRFFKGWLMLGLLEEKAGNIEQAIKGYTSFLQTSGQQNQPMEQHILNLTFKQVTHHQKQNASLFLGKPCIEKTMTLFKQKRYTQALASINQCIKENSDEPRAKLLKIQILIKMENSDAAMAQLKEWINQNPDQQLWFTTLHLLTHMQVPTQKIIDILKTIYAKHTKNIWAPLYLADLYMRQEQYTDALTLFNNVIETIQDKELKTRVYFQIALINYDQHALSDVKNAIEKGLNLTTTYAPLLNLAAYFYATKDNKTHKAQDLIARALRIEPTNPHYLDTQAVIFYQQGSYDKAETILSKLTEHIHNDATILINNAKALFKLGKKEDAYTLIKQAKPVALHTHEKKKIAKLTQKWHIT